MTVTGIMMPACWSNKRVIPSFLPRRPIDMAVEEFEI
jgi:hypothetical protein